MLHEEHPDRSGEKGRAFSYMFIMVNIFRRMDRDQMALSITRLLHGLNQK
jgi:hypothetical protein